MIHKANTFFVGGLLAFTLAAGGCVSNPFSADPLDTHTVASPERLRSINTLILTQAVQDDAQPMSTAETLKQARARFKDIDRVDLTLDHARISALSNNLGLSATLISPVIAAERVSEEEGRFEALFTLNASAADNDNATASSLSGGQSTVRSITPGVTVPLRTGGSLSITLPFSRVETDNSFSFLNPSYTSDLNFSLSHNL